MIKMLNSAVEAIQTSTLRYISIACMLILCATAYGDVSHLRSCHNEEVPVSTRPKVGLALGGGGAKGAAHVGVLKVLEEVGVPIDYIAGTSIGAIVGGLYSTGYTSAELDTLFRQQEWLSLLTDRDESLSSTPYKMKDGVVFVFGFPVFDTKETRIGALRGQKIEQMLDSMMGVKGMNVFDELPIPFRCVATEFKTAQKIVIHSGLPAQGMRASMAIPGVFKPVKINNLTLVDGGMVDNLPVDIVREMGADIVIAIDLQQKKEQPAKQHNLGMLSAAAEMLGIGGLLDWVNTRPDITLRCNNIADADIYINPPISDQDATSFGSNSISEMIELGESAARAHIDELTSLLGKLFR